MKIEANEWKKGATLIPRYQLKKRGRKAKEEISQPKREISR